MKDFEEHGTILGIGAIYFWVTFGLLLSGSIIVAVVRPTFLGFEREAFVNSHQYVESQRDQLLTNIEKYDELEAEIAKYEQGEGNEKIVSGLRAQQKSLKSRIKASLERIPEEHHPSNTERFK